MIMGSPVRLGDGVDVADVALANLSFIVYSFGARSGRRSSRWVLADPLGLFISLTFGGPELFHASSTMSFERNSLAITSADPAVLNEWRLVDAGEPDWRGSDSAVVIVAVFV
jgi:hypothetical protein